ncbi:MAG: hypothetical protein ACSLFH_01175 [Desulfuromonadales bacterium]
MVSILGLMVNKSFHVLWKTPTLLDRCLDDDWDDFNVAFLDIQSLRLCSLLLLAFA